MSFIIKSSTTQRISFLAVLAVLFLSFSPGAFAQQGVTTLSGPLPSDPAAMYLIEVPANWNGILFLYSHGYVVPGKPNPAQDVGDPATRLFMLLNGFALAGSSYATTGWAIHEALPDQIAVLDQFNALVGKTPIRTIAWGHSLGGIITAGLIQRYPSRFDAALPMCGVLSGGVATWNTALDFAFAFNTLLAGGALQVVKIADPGTNFLLAENKLAIAQSTPQGQARLALAVAIADGPGWFDPFSPEPAPSDFASQNANQFLWAETVDLPFAFGLRAELEFRAQGNPSSNTGVNYRSLLARSIDRNEVVALYQQAGLDLDADLQTLQDAVRISADPSALHYLETNIIFDGQIHIPVLSMHTKGDGEVLVQNESAYLNVVTEAGNSDFLRQTFVHRAGHCAFTPAETIAAVQSLLFRLNTGTWGLLDANSLNAAASALGPLNIVPPAFFDFTPSPYLRPSDALGGQCQSDPVCRAQFPAPE